MLKTLSAKFTRITLLMFFILNFNNANAQNKSTEILWDNYGVPHIYANNTADMYYAFGWAQAQNHADLLLRLYAQARGRASEFWGENFVISDHQIHLFNLPALAIQHYAKQDKETKSHLDAFVNGINAYVQKNGSSIDSTSRLVYPITSVDVIAHALRVINLEFLGGEDIANTRRSLAPGSNAYAIGPSKSASKKAMLVSNPHLPWQDLYTFFEAHLNAPGFSAYGTSLLGQSNLNIAFNNNLGWTHTVNTIDASDRYELTLQQDGYLLDGATLPFEKRTVTLKVRQPNGSTKDKVLELRNSKHGPVMGEKNGKAYAVRIAGLENAFQGKQYHQMAKAKNYKEFEAAIRMMQNPMFNIIYADKDGNIMYLFNGNIPVRSEGDWSFWRGTVNGTSSKYIWNSYHRFEDLPKVLNPATGFVQNANDPPWLATYPATLKAVDFPGYMSPQMMPLRPQRSINLIKDDPSITFEELIGYKLNTGMEAADRFLDDLLNAVQQSTDTLAQRSATILKQWDRSTNSNSRGAVLFAAWMDKLSPQMFNKQWSMAEPLTTPDGLKDPQGAVALLVKAAEEVQKSFGSIDVAWGDVNRFKVGSYNLPGNGGSGNYGIYRTMHFSRMGADPRKYAVHGDTYVAVTEFADKVRAQVLLSYGNASQPGNKHVGDQLQLLSDKKLRPALLDKNEVLKNMEQREVLNIRK
jgi:acyl-homoserine-lactone acylase